MIVMLCCRINVSQKGFIKLPTYQGSYLESLDCKKYMLSDWRIYIMSQFMQGWCLSLGLPTSEVSPKCVNPTG